MSQNSDRDVLSNSYDDDVRNVEDFESNEIKINPGYYIHLALVKSQYVLTKDNLKEGLVQFSMLVNFMEGICRSANNLLDEDYDKEVKEYVESLDNDLRGETREAKIANKKVELLLRRIFGNADLSSPLRV